MDETNLPPPASPVPAAPLPPRLDRADKLAFALAALPALCVYLATLPPDLTMEDAGINATAAFYSSPAGPPGYPVWVLYSSVFVKLLPFSNIAWRVSVGSAVAGGVACGIIAMLISFTANALLRETLLAQRLSADEWRKLRIVSGAVAALVLGFAGVFWGEILIATPSGLDWMLFAATLWFLARVMFDPPGRWRLWLAFLCFGMMHTGDPELLIALPGFILLVMAFDVRLGRDLALFVVPLAFALTLPMGWSALRGHEPFIGNWPMTLAFVVVFMSGVAAAIATRGVGGQWKSALVALLGLVAGLAFYLYIPIAAMSTPPIQWGYPRTLEGFLHLVSRGQYEMVYPTHDLHRFAMQLWNHFSSIGRNIGSLYLGIAVVGGVTLARVAGNARRWLAGLAAIWVCTGPLMIAMLNPAVDRQHSELVTPFCPPSWTILVVLIGLGLVTIGAWVAGWGTKTGPAAPPATCASS